MTTYDYETSTNSGSTGTKEQAQQAAQTARDESMHVGEVAKSEAKDVLTDAQQQARSLLDEALAQVTEQSRTQLDSLVTTLQGFADDLQKMVRGEGAGGGLAADVVGQVSDRAKAVSAQLQGSEPGEVLDQVRAFARRRPGTFLAGALVAGVVAGRFARGAKGAHDQDAGPTRPATSPASTTAGEPAPTTTTAAPVVGATGGTAAGDPLGGTGVPTSAPAFPEAPETPGGSFR